MHTSVIILEKEKFLSKKLFTLNVPYCFSVCFVQTVKDIMKCWGDSAAALTSAFSFLF